jgi:hypothetical protein
MKYQTAIKVGLSELIYTILKAAKFVIILSVTSFVVSATTETFIQVYQICIQDTFPFVPRSCERYTFVFLICFNKELVFSQSWSCSCKLPSGSHGRRSILYFPDQLLGVSPKFFRKVFVFTVPTAANFYVCGLSQHRGKVTNEMSIVRFLPVAEAGTVIL